ncbi:MAG: hypothetical protein GY859_02000 [Desulfobacterales bacterium]|nr:hypothetical protein [Desulfobacterales bacterium]
MTKPPPPHIKRRVPKPGDLDFTNLKKEGLRRIRNLTGKVWTDYNAHDPGITILEQLCYALTDLHHRTEFPMADYLTGSDGKIDFKKQLLFPPDEVFPSHPVTAKDYRRILLDAFREIDNVWMQDVKEGPPGLYDIVINLRGASLAAMNQRSQLRLIRKVAEHYHRHRNMCEDVNQILISKNKYYHLHGDIEIASPDAAARTLADVYLQCGDLIDPDVIFYDYEKLQNKGVSLEELFSGPLTRHGHVYDHQLQSGLSEIHISEVIRIVNKTPGVKGAKALRLTDENNNEIERIDNRDPRISSPCLFFPKSSDKIFIRLYYKGRKVRLFPNELFKHLEKQEFLYNARRFTRQDIPGLYTLPTGRRRNIEKYYSIQNEFPAAYGINAFGAPSSESPAVKARAKQLKAYLLIFEQLMANFLSNLKNIPELFSAEETLQSTCFHQVLDNAVAPNANELYKNFHGKDKNNPSFEESLEKAIRRYDNYHDRRNRLLDYLLALHGETFETGSLEQFNFYYTEDEINEIAIRNKIKFLQNIIAINKNRSRSFNYKILSWNTGDVSGLKLKTSLLLGLPYYHNRSLTSVFVRYGLKIISDKALKEMNLGSMELEFASLDRIENRIISNFHSVVIDLTQREIEPGAIRMLLGEIMMLKNNVITESFLRFGIETNRYRLGSFTKDTNSQLIFQPREGAEWCYMGTYGRKKKAEFSVNALYRFIRMLNIESEGFHVVEHILLRPQFTKGSEYKPPPDFFPLRVSILFPSWTARFTNTAFRELAEDTLRVNCPAHIHPTFYWLDFDRMLEFELLYKRWLILKSDPDADRAEIDQLSEKIAQFLLDKGKGKSK